MVISQVLHIRPWEQLEHLTVTQFLAAVAYVDAYNAANAQGS